MIYFTFMNVSVKTRSGKNNHLHDLKTVWHNAYNSDNFPSSAPLQITNRQGEKCPAEECIHHRKGQNSLPCLSITYFILIQWYSLEWYPNLHVSTYFEKNKRTAWMWKGLDLKLRDEATNFKNSLYYFKAFLTLWIINSQVAMGCILIKVNL